jgi:hypothetical protein
MFPAPRGTLKLRQATRKIVPISYMRLAETMCMRNPLLPVTNPLSSQTDVHISVQHWPVRITLRPAETPVASHAVARVQQNLYDQTCF